ncbi:MAG: EpsG family protein [Fibrobacterales bacterium]
MNEFIPIYLLLTATFLFSFESQNKIAGKVGVFISATGMLFCLFFTFVFGWPGGDRFSYWAKFETWRSFSFQELIQLEDPEFMWRLITWSVGQATETYEVFFIIILGIMVGGLYWTLSLIYARTEKWAMLTCFMLYPFFLNYATNTLRQGIAQSFILLGIACWFKDQKKIGISFVAFAYFWHGSMLMFVPLVICFFVLNRSKFGFKFAVTVFMSSLFLSITKINSFLSTQVPKLIDLKEKELYYFDEEKIKVTGYATGAKPGFIIFSSFPLVLYFLFRNDIPDEKKYRVQYWLGAYLILNSVLHFFSFAPYSDRFAGASWFMFPIVCFEVLRARNVEYGKNFLKGFPLFNAIILPVYTYIYFSDFQW